MQESWSSNWIKPKWLRVCKQFCCSCLIRLLIIYLTSNNLNLIMLYLLIYLVQKKISYCPIEENQIRDKIHTRVQINLLNAQSKKERQKTCDQCTISLDKKFTDKIYYILIRIYIILNSLMINFVIENDWKWNHCRLPIKRNEKHMKRKEQEYFYQVINSEQTGAINEQKVKIVLDRQFPFQPDTGFVWHKSWNLPEITVSINQQLIIQLLSQYKQIKCQIMSVYPIKYSSSYYLNEILLEGCCVKSFHQSQTIFKFLKFGETSFNHNRNKFCLLVWIYGQNAYKDKDDLFCLISSPIYVDSRKQARKKDVQSTHHPVIHSFNKFMATIKGMKGNFPNSSDGFLSYYGAQNIRNKIKHPFYVAYHFDKVFHLYLNIDSKLTLAQALNRIQTVRINEGIKQGQSVLALQIVDHSEKNRKKIISIVEKWKFGMIDYIYQGKLIELDKWAAVTKQQIRSSYKIHYENQIFKEDDYNAKKQDEDDNREQDRNKEPIQQFIDQKVFDVEKNYELRTIIQLSKPKKKVKIEQKQC